MKAIVSFLPLLTAAIGLLFSGCGKSKPPSTAPSTTVETPSDGVRTIQLTGNDTMQYNINEIRVQAGESIRVVFTNIGKMPKQAMSHNWVLLKPMDPSAMNAWAMSAATKAPTYLPDDKSAILASTQMLGPGESDTIEFAAPEQPGTYPYLCTFPGHFAIMKGTLIVE